MPPFRGRSCSSLSRQGVIGFLLRRNDWWREAHSPTIQSPQKVMPRHEASCPCRHSEGARTFPCSG
ncbi:MAG: hypothetical protein ACLFT3_18465, partial [Cyclobacteriaceae bacterium]